MYRRVRRFCRNKSTNANKAPYNIFNPHSKVEEGQPVPPLSSHTLTPGKSWVQVAAIDPAVKNCAIRVERREDGKLPETILFKKLNFLEPPSKDSEYSMLQVIGSESTCHLVYISEYLSRYAEYFASCQYILIEAQMGMEMNRISQAIITTLCFIVRDRGVKPLIVEIDPRLKSSTFGAPRMKYAVLKKWSLQKAIEILNSNQEPDVAKYLETISKGDDLADVVCYTSAWFKILENGVFTPPKISEITTI